MHGVLVLLFFSEFLFCFLFPLLWRNFGVWHRAYTVMSPIHVVTTLHMFNLCLLREGLSLSATNSSLSERVIHQCCIQGEAWCHQLSAACADVKLLLFRRAFSFNFKSFMVLIVVVFFVL